MHKAIAQS